MCALMTGEKQQNETGATKTCWGVFSEEYDTIKDFRNSHWSPKNIGLILPWLIVSCSLQSSILLNDNGHKIHCYHH